MANFAGFDQDVNVSLESKFFPKIEKSQTVENENRQHELFIAIVKMEYFFLFDQTLMNTYKLAHEFYEVQLHSDNGIPPTEERDTDARIVSHTDPDAILLDEKMRFSCTCNRCKNNASERQTFKYSFLDILTAVCEDAFIFIQDIGNKAFKNLKQHYKVNETEPQIHDHKGSRAPQAISFNDIENATRFIKSMFCLRVVRCFFLWDLPFSPHVPIDSAQND